MAEAVGTCETCETFLEYLKGLPWCRQGGDTLVAVHKCTAEVIQVFADHEVSVFPGEMKVKMQKSWLSFLQEKLDEELPIPVLIVWKPQAVELWYRRHKSWDFPYDTWSDPVAAAYEREKVTLPAEHASSVFGSYHGQIVATAKECPPVIPAQ